MAFEDLIKQSKTDDGKYVDLVFTDLDPDTIYGLRFAWEYEDPSLGIGGVSNFSDVFSLSTLPEPEFAAPNFDPSDLTAKNGFLLINWNGNGITNVPILNIKQVNVWIKGGSFGAEYVKVAQSFTKASQLTIPVNAGQYCVKLQAESELGTLSAFSQENCVEVYKSPKPVTSVQGRWVKDDLTSKTDTLMATFTFDPNYSDASNSNKDADYFLITLSANGKSRTYWSPVNKSSSNQIFFLSAIDNKAGFGLFATQFEIFILVRDTFGQVSTVVEAQSLTYETPLDTPIITASEATLAYTVSYNNQTGKPFDNIYIYEDTGSGFSQVAQGTSNPIVVPTTNTLQRSVKAKFYDSNGGSTSFSNTVLVTPVGVVTVDNEGPANVTSVTVDSGIDTSGYLGFNAYADVSWPAVSGGGIRGYRIRFSNDDGATYSYVDSPGPGTKYRLGGLAVGSTYKIAVATYDEYNNTSTSYISASDVTVTGAPSVSSYITAGPFQFGVGVGSVPTNKGLYFNSSNYWYINSSDSARLKLGGDTSNYLLWNGDEFLIDGNLSARKGTFRGNVSIVSGGSLSSGTLDGDSLVGAGYLLNSNGLTFNSSSVTDITTINAATGKLTTSSATIGGWDVSSNTISKNGITLNSSGKIIANKDAYYIGIEPKSASANDIVLWAGQSSTGGTVASGPSFRVTAAGTLYASGAVISGDITLTNGSGLSTLIDSKASIFRSTSAPSGSTYKVGDLWVDTDDSNKVYQWNGGAWVVVQDSATALSTATAASSAAEDATDAASAATSAATAATNAASAATSAATIASNKAQKFDSTTGNLITGLTLSTSSASIYSTKSSYTDSTNGWYLGWKSVGGGSFTPAIAIGGATTYLKYATDTGLEIKGNVTATTGQIGGWDISDTTIYKGAISLNSSTGTITGATITGGVIYSGTASISSGVVTGATIVTNGSGYGQVKLNSDNNTIEILNSSNGITGSIYGFNNGGEFILQHGGKTALGYPASSAYITLNPSTTTIGYTNSLGYSTHTFSISSSGSFTFFGREVYTGYGGAIGTGNYYMRNIGMGTGAKSTSDTDGLRGDIWIQYS
jgi:hypothetical protein